MGEELCCLQGDLGQMGDLIPDCPDPSWLKGGCWGLEPLAGGSAPQDVKGCGSAGLILLSLQLNEANERYTELEERMQYTRSLCELVRNHFGVFSAENEALDISVRRHLSRLSQSPSPITTSA